MKNFIGEYRAKEHRLSQSPNLLQDASPLVEVSGDASALVVLTILGVIIGKLVGLLFGQNTEQIFLVVFILLFTVLRSGSIFQKYYIRYRLRKIATKVDKLKDKLWTSTQALQVLVGQPKTECLKQMKIKKSRRVTEELSLANLFLFPHQLSEVAGNWLLSLPFAALLQLRIAGQFILGKLQSRGRSHKTTPFVPLESFHYLHDHWSQETNGGLFSPFPKPWRREEPLHPMAQAVLDISRGEIPSNMTFMDVPSFRQNWTNQG